MQHPFSVKIKDWYVTAALCHCYFCFMSVVSTAQLKSLIAAINVLCTIANQSVNVGNVYQNLVVVEIYEHQNSVIFHTMPTKCILI